MTRKDLFMRSYGWVGALLFALGLALAIAFAVLWSLSVRLWADGESTEAEVTGAYETTRRSPGQPVSTVYEVAVRYVVDGETHEVRKPVPRWFYERVRNDGEQRETIRVTYVASDPGQVEFVRGRYGRLAQWLLVGAVVALAGGGVWARRAWRRAGEVIALRTTGTRCTVPVKRLLDTTFNHDGVRQYRIVWAEPDGSEGRSYMIAKERAERHPPGSEIEIYRDPGGRLPSVWAGDID